MRIITINNGAQNGRMEHTNKQRKNSEKALVIVEQAIAKYYKENK